MSDLSYVALSDLEMGVVVSDLAYVTLSDLEMGL